MLPGVPRGPRFTEACITKLTNVLVSDLTTKSSARQGIRRPPPAGLKRRRGKGGSWLALGSAVRPQPQPWPPAPESPWRPAQLPRAPPRLPTSRSGQLRSPRDSENPRAPRGVSQCSPQPRAPPSLCSAGSARGRPAELARLTCAVAAGRFPAPRSAPGLGSRHPLRDGDGCGHAGRGADPPRPEPPGASGRGGPTGERRTRGSGPGTRLGTPPGSLRPVARSPVNASRSLNAPVQNEPFPPSLAGWEKSADPARSS